MKRNDDAKGYNMTDWQQAPRYDTCFVCGEKNKCGLDMAFMTKDNRARAIWEPREHHCGYKGVVHGGVSATLLDEAMGWAGWQTYKRNFFTVELKIRYRKPVRTGIKYFVETTMLVSRGKFYTAEGRIVDADGVVYVEGEAKYFLRDDI